MKVIYLKRGCIKGAFVTTRIWKEVQFKLTKTAKDKNYIFSESRCKGEFVTTQNLLAEIG